MSRSRGSVSGWPRRLRVRAVLRQVLEQYWRPLVVGMGFRQRRQAPESVASMVLLPGAGIRGCVGLVSRRHAGDQLWPVDALPLGSRGGLAAFWIFFAGVRAGEKPLALRRG